MTFLNRFKGLAIRGLGISCVLVAGGWVLTGCQSAGHTSSHVSVGAVTGPDGRQRVQAVPQPLEASQPAPPQPKPAPPAATRVEVLPANPEAGVPLGDDTEVEVVSLLPVAEPEQAKPQRAQASQEPPAPVPTQTTEASEPTWLERFPHLSEDVESYKSVIANLEQEVQRYREQLSSLRERVEQNWGTAAATATSAHQFVKYTDSYQSRGEMDFDQGKIVVETVDQSNPKEHLRQAIVTTLLTPYDADDPEIFTDKNISYSGPALLAGQVQDHDGVPVRWEWRANRYAQHLVDNEMQEVQRNGQVVYRVEIPLVANHNEVRGQKYEHLVRDASRRYQIDEALIYAIMETESHFNPYAMSHIPAYGLMQVVPATAGRDVYERIRKRNDQPTQQTLFNPTENIDIGTAYLTILRDIYLKDIRHPQSKEYAMITAYNGGAGSVLRTFHQDRSRAIEVINQLSPQQVYDRLHNDHPFAEARGYIKKVTEALGRYRALASAP